MLQISFCIILKSQMIAVPPRAELERTALMLVSDMRKVISRSLIVSFLITKFVIVCSIQKNYLFLTEILLLKNFILH